MLELGIKTQMYFFYNFLLLYITFPALEITKLNYLKIRLPDIHQCYSCLEEWIKNTNILNFVLAYLNACFVII